MKHAFRETVRSKLISLLAYVFSTLVRLMLRPNYCSEITVAILDENGVLVYGRQHKSDRSTKPNTN